MYISHHYVIITIKIDIERDLVVHTIYIPNYCKYYVANITYLEIAQLSNEFLELIIPSLILENSHLLDNLMSILCIINHLIDSQEILP